MCELRRVWFFLLWRMSFGSKRRVLLLLHWQKNSKRKREKHQTFSECIETAESCANKECCEPCGLILDESEWMDGAPEEGATDVTNTEAPTTGATPEDTADGGKKDESKSDGCSMLFI